VNLATLKQYEETVEELNRLMNEELSKYRLLKAKR